MQRKKFIKRFLLLGGGAVAAVSGFKAYHVFKSPDFGLLTEALPLISELADTIIPRTDTPGAKDAGVGAFIVLMVKDCCPTATQNRFIDGVKDLAIYTQMGYGRPFDKCSIAERTAVLKHFEKKSVFFKGTAAKVEHKLLGDPFFTTLKKYTVLGYCSSKAGATQALAYQAVPGHYINTDLKPGQKAWATQ
ncbi:MAG: twin-arginine translocation pathway signal protein [Citrobacter freundii]|nr:MAG: twin-arginine translocation pathway signal protein [Citrobacter freundii]